MYSQSKVIIKEFSKVFAGYEYPFENANAKIILMSESERYEYFRQAKESILESKVWKIEMQELIRTYMKKLSFEVTDQIEQSAYRLTLIALQRLEARMVELAQRYKPENYAKKV